MIKLKSILIPVLLFLSLTVSSCSSAPLGGLQSYIDAADGYQFLYPNGWMAVDVKNATEGVDVVFRDFIERSENLSVIISDVNQDKKLEDLGTPTEVGYRFMEMVNQNGNNSGRKAELISARKKEYNLKNYYILEYEVQLPNDEQRHNIASVVTNKGKLYTFNISTSESRWQAVKDLFQTVVNSFTLSS